MKRHFIWACLLVCSTMWAQQTTSIAEAMENYEYETAIHLIEQQPATPQLLLQKAKALKGLYRYAEAAATLKDVINGLPDHQLVLFELAECSRLAGQFNDAATIYEKILEINPQHSYARTQYVSLLFSLDKYRQARKSCQEMLAQDNSTIALRLMAQCYEGLQQADSAIVYYQKALKREPGDYASTVRLASIYVQSDQPEAAVDITESYRKKDKDNVQINRLNAQAYCLAKDYDIAIERYEHLMNQGDSTRLTTFYLGISYFVKEKFYEAHDCLEISRKYDPKNVNLLYYLGRACAKTSWKLDGIEYLKQAIDLTIPSDADVAKLYAGLGECYFHADQFKNYIAALQSQRKYEPDKPYLLYRIGAVYQDCLEDTKNAEKYLEMYLKTKPKDLDKEEPAKMEGGNVVVGPQAVYKSAESRLNAIREVKFFRDGIKEEDGNK